MNIYGIRFGNHGNIQYFSSDTELEADQRVVVPLEEQGQALGEVLSRHEAVPAGENAETIRPILRLAQESDYAEDEENKNIARRAFHFCQECIATRKLEMKLVEVEVYHDRSKIIFFFTAPARIDFRELVKDLVREYRSRIELRQIGVRHETQMVGAVGNCGMVCCCRRFLRKFAPVTIRMAKEQNLFLNPAKISGICGRLLCCLSYEQDNYDAFHRSCPKLGKKYQTNQGDMKVLRTNMFRNSVAVLNENNEESEITLDAWHALEPHRPEQPANPQPPKAATADNGLLVVSVDPDTVDDFPFDSLSEEEQDILAPDMPDSRSHAPQGQQGAGGGGKKRKRTRKKPQNEE